MGSPLEVKVRLDQGYVPGEAYCHTACDLVTFVEYRLISKSGWSIHGKVDGKAKKFV